VKRTELLAFENRDVRITLEGGDVLLGHFDDDGEGTISFWPLPALSDRPGVVRNLGAATEIPYDEITKIELQA